jgi:hypothetical protein
MRASIPEPEPIEKGVPVTPAVLHDLHVLKRGAQEEGRTLDMYHFQELAELVVQRDLFGRSKYGQPLMTLDGRSGKEDAMQELGDLMQYVKKITLSGEMNIDRRIEMCELLKTAFKVMRVWLKEGWERVDTWE